MDPQLIQMGVIVAVLFIALKLLPRLIAGVPFVSPEKVHETLQNNENAILIDVRTPQEFNASHARESLHVEPVDFSKDIEDKRPYMNQPVFVICQTSQRAAMAAKMLKKLGFTNVAVVEGGLKKWKKKNLPIN